MFVEVADVVIHLTLTKITVLNAIQLGHANAAKLIPSSFLMHAAITVYRVIKTHLMVLTITNVKLGQNSSAKTPSVIQETTEMSVYKMLSARIKCVLAIDAVYPNSMAAKVAILLAIVQSVVKILTITTAGVQGVKVSEANIQYRLSAREVRHQKMNAYSSLVE